MRNQSTVHVRDYLSGKTLVGTASAALIEESAAAGPTGAVSAHRDAGGAWQYVAPCDVERARAQRLYVWTVYVET